jgi:hypothetical protein
MDWGGIRSRCLWRILTQLLSLGSTTNTSRRPISATHHLADIPLPLQRRRRGQTSTADLARVMLFGNGRWSLVAQHGSNGVEYLLFQGGEGIHNLKIPLSTSWPWNATLVSCTFFGATDKWGRAITAPYCQRVCMDYGGVQYRWGTDIWKRPTLLWSWLCFQSQMTKTNSCFSHYNAYMSIF